MPESKVKRISGINPKHWFYLLYGKLKSDPEKVRGIITGAACEQWINSEFFDLIRKDINENEYDFSVASEYEKKDIVVGKYEGSDKFSQVLAHIETKVIYNGYSPGKQREYIRTLVSQITPTSDQHHMGIGLVLCPYYVEIDKSGTAELAARLKIGEERKKLNDLIRGENSPVVQLGKQFNLSMDHGASLETIVDCDVVKNGPYEYYCGLWGQYFVVRP